MGGGDRKKFNKSRSRRKSQSSSGRALFVQGGVLDDWSSPSVISHSSSGRNFSGENGKGKSDASRSRRGKGKHGSCSASGSGYGSTSGGDRVKSRGNGIDYVYPCFNSQDNLFPNVDEEKMSDLESQPMILLDSKETPIMAYVDEGPNKNMPSTEYAYDYTAGFTLDESSRRGLKIDHEAKETSACSGLSSEMEKKEDSSKGSTPTDGLEQNIQGTDHVYCYNKDFSLEKGCHRSSFDDEAKETVASFSNTCKLEDKSGFIESSPANEDEMIVEDSADSDTSTKTEDDVLGTSYSPDRNPGFVCIAGRKIYTRDLSDSESDEEEFVDKESSDYSETEDFSDPSDSGSEIDDVIAEDYFQGIGGGDDFINIDQLVGMVPAVLDDDSDSSDSLDKTVEKLGGIALQEASKEYGMMKLQPARKAHREDHKITPGKYDMVSAMDDFMLIKDPRTVYGRKKHTRTPQSWRFDSRKSQKGRKFPGEKKKHRKEMITLKRRERMISRGVDLQHINSKLQQLILDGGDILSFQPMHTRDCSQVQKLAAMYRLRSASQGSGKKKCVIVTRTPHTCMPSPTDRVRLEKFIGSNDEDGDFAVCDVKSVGEGKKTKKASRYTDSSIRNLQADLSKKKKKSMNTTTSYAAQPVSFISSGVMVSDMVEATNIESSETNETCHDSKDIPPSSLAYGSFELHTTGFGSKMMAKMGYVEGRGLGKDGQGMAQPIEVLQRPKSLGLGADIPESTIIPEAASGKLAAKNGSVYVRREHSSAGTNGKDGKRKGKRAESQQFGAFEKYTTGFGSRMMAKMGFVEGTGLGKNSQGVVTPLAAIRRPKSQGLGAKQ